MSTWRIGDATVKSGGKSTDPDIERELKIGAAYFEYGPPPGMWVVDPKNDWTIHQWLSEIAAENGEKLTTDYKPTDADMPKDIADYMRHCTENPSPPGTVH